MMAIRRAVVLDRSGGRSWRARDGESIVSAEEWELIVITDRQPLHAPDGVRVVSIGDFNETSIRRKVEELVTERAIDRISTTSEHYLETIAELREKYGIPGNGVHYTARVRDKWLMKKAALASGIPTLDGALASDANSWAQALPPDSAFVLKPRSESGSQGVRLAANKDELVMLIEQLDTPTDYLVELYSGAEILHVDVLVASGQVVFEVSQYVRPCHVSGGNIPLSSFTVDDASLRAMVSRTLHKLINGWRVNADVLHVEFFAEGNDITLLEVAGRPGAAGVAEVFLTTRGFDLIHAKTLLDFGLDPLPRRQPRQAPHGGWSVFYAPTLEPATVDDSNLDFHETRSILASDARRIDGIAGLGIAMYSFAGNTPGEVRALIDLYEREVRIWPTETVETEKVKK